MSEAIRKAVAEARRPDPLDQCPVAALGQRNGVYYFLSLAGEIRDFRPRDMTVLGLLSLFNGDAGWLVEHFGKVDRRENPTGEIDAQAAAGALMRKCAAAGLWRLDTPKRSVGVWADGEGGVIAHCGDTMFLYGAARRRRAAAGLHVGDAVYIAAPAIAPPLERAMDAAGARALHEAIAGLWRFAAPHAARMVFGFLGLACLGAAPAWRVHVLMTGVPGKAGKSALLKLLAGALGVQANFTNDPTEAGLREMLTDEARTIIFDEAGAQGGEDRGFRVEHIIGLLRRMANEEGARSVRGTGSGARQYVMAGAAALAAANAPVLDAQDRSRILEIEMLPADPANKARVQAAIAAAAAGSAALRARALQGWGRFAANLAVYHGALIAAQCDARQADQLGALFAAAEMLASDEAIDSHGAEADIEKYRGVIAAFLADAEELSNARRCLGVLMSTPVDHWKSGAKSTLGRLVQLARTGPAERQALVNYGLRLESLADGGVELWVAQTHEVLSRIFAATDWRGGGWRGALKQLPRAEVPDMSRWFHGVKSRFVVIPEAYLPRAELVPDAELPP